MKRIRWQGLGAFLLIIVVIGCFWYLLADSLIKRSIEKTGSLIVGAEVNVGSADLTLMPLGVKIHDLQVTDPEEPTKNAVQVAQIAFSVSTGDLFLRKLIIEKMGIDGVELGTQRERPGFVRTKVKEEIEEEEEPKFLGFTLPSFSRDDILKVLEKEDLQTASLISSVQQDARVRTEFWQNRLEELPNKEKIEQYRERIEKLKGTKRGDVQGMLSAATEIRTLQNDIQSDIDLLKSTKQDFSQELDGLKNRISEALKAPLEDARKLAQKYGPTSEGIGNVSGLIFGPRVKTWVDRSLWWYQRITPYLERVREKQTGKKVSKPLRAKGLDVHFREFNPKPDFLIQSTTASVNLAQGLVTGTITNITTEQDILGLPCSFSFSGEELKQLERLSLSGKLDHIDPSQSKDEIELTATGYPLESLKLGSEQLDLALEKALVDLNLNATSIEDSLKASIGARARSARFVLLPPQEQAMIYESLAKAFSSVNDFSLSADIAGTLENYDISISSDLDRVIQRVLGDVARELTTKFQADMIKEIHARFDEQLSALNQQTQGLSQVDGELATRLTMAQDLLKNDLFKSVKPGVKLPF
ncbi:MAG: TIGR03545 family protein [Desulfomonilia bacterium]